MNWFLNSSSSLNIDLLRLRSLSCNAASCRRFSSSYALLFQRNIVKDLDRVITLSNWKQCITKNIMGLSLPLFQLSSSSSCSGIGILLQLRGHTEFTQINMNIQPETVVAPCYCGVQLWRKLCSVLWNYPKSNDRNLLKCAHIDAWQIPVTLSMCAWRFRRDNCQYWKAIASATAAFETATKSLAVHSRLHRLTARLPGFPTLLPRILPQTLDELLASRLTNASVYQPYCDTV